MFWKSGGRTARQRPGATRSELKNGDQLRNGTGIGLPHNWRFRKGMKSEARGGGHLNLYGRQSKSSGRRLRFGVTVEDRVGEASTLNQIGLFYFELGDTQQALQYHNQALPLCRAVRDLRGESITINNIGTVYLSMGELQKALEYYGQALILKQSIGDRKSEANTIYHIATAYSRLGELQKALEYYDRALPLTRVTGERRGRIVNT